MKPPSIDLRQRIVNSVRHEKNTADEAAMRFNVSRASVDNYLQLDQDLGDLTPQKAQDETAESQPNKNQTYKHKSKPSQMTRSNSTANAGQNKLVCP